MVEMKQCETLLDIWKSLYTSSIYTSYDKVLNIGNPCWAIHSVFDDTIKLYGRGEYLGINYDRDISIISYYKNLIGPCITRSHSMRLFEHTAKFISSSDAIFVTDDFMDKMIKFDPKLVYMTKSYFRFI